MLWSVEIFLRLKQGDVESGRIFVLGTGVDGGGQAVGVIG